MSKTKTGAVADTDTDTDMLMRGVEEPNSSEDDEASKKEGPTRRAARSADASAGAGAGSIAPKQTPEKLWILKHDVQDEVKRNLGGSYQISGDKRSLTQDVLKKVWHHGGINELSIVNIVGSGSKPLIRGGYHRMDDIIDGLSNTALIAGYISNIAPGVPLRLHIWSDYAGVASEEAVSDLPIGSVVMGHSKKDSRRRGIGTLEESSFILPSTIETTSICADLAANLLLWADQGLTISYKTKSGKSISHTFEPRVDDLSDENIGPFIVNWLNAVFSQLRQLERDGDLPDNFGPLPAAFPEFSENQISKFRNRYLSSQILNKGLERVLPNKEMVRQVNDWTPPFPALAYAVETGNLDVVKKYVDDFEAKVLVEKEDGTTPLSAAVASEAVEIVDYLLERGAADELTDASKASRRLLSASGKHLSIAYLLLSHIADSEVFSSASSDVLAATIKYGLFDMFGLLVSFGAKLPHQDEISLKKYMRRAVSHKTGDNVPMVKYLLDMGAGVNWMIPDAYPNKKQQSPALYRAVSQGNLELIKLLVERGAEISSYRDSFDLTITQIAELHWPHIASYLKSISASAGAGTLDNNAAMFSAAERGNWGEVVALMKRSGESLNINAQDEEGYSLLSRAISTGEKEIVYLLLKLGADANREETGYSMLMCAVDLGHAEIVELLLRHGAEVNKIASDGKTTALSIAEEKDDASIIKILKAAGGVAAGDIVNDSDIDSDRDEGLLNYHTGTLEKPTWAQRFVRKVGEKYLTHRESSKVDEADEQFAKWGR